MSCPSCQLGATRTWECVRVLREALRGAWSLDPRIPEVAGGAWYGSDLEGALEYVAYFRGAEELLGMYRSAGPSAIATHLVHDYGLTGAQVECVRQARDEWRAATSPSSSSWFWWALGAGAVLAAGIGTAVVLHRRRRGMSGPGDWHLAPNGHDYRSCTDRRGTECCVDVVDRHRDIMVQARCGGRVRWQKGGFDNKAAAMRLGSTWLAAQVWTAPTRISASTLGRTKSTYRLLVRDPETGRWETFQDGLSRARAERLATAQIRAWRGSKGQDVYVTEADVRVELE